jgi:hypothetical protein
MPSFGRAFFVYLILYPNWFMNRLILIGNGFDLAHGLKTSYNDFILWYLKDCLVKTNYHPWDYEDDLISAESNVNARFRHDFEKFVSGFIDHYYEEGFTHIIDGINYKDGRGIPTPFNIKIKSELFKILLTKCSNANWVDIENEFYQQLKNILELDLDERKEALWLLNQSLTNIVAKLKEYLNTIKPDRYNEDYGLILKMDIQNNELIQPILEKDEQPKETHILNFNYTSTIENYLPKPEIVIKKSNVTVNYIHGKLGSERNPLIFGFGDELDDDYLKIEREKTKGFFQNIKSFWYFKTPNYHNLIRFIDSDDYQVFILGHSCGLSDRTMLNMVFEHQNCKSIKIFYYKDDEGSNNFTDLTQEISRHFKNKGDMRKKIVHFENSQPMPQIY